MREDLQPHPHTIPLIGELCLVQLFTGTLGTKALESKIGKLCPPLDQAQPNKTKGNAGICKGKEQSRNKLVFQKS